MRRYTLGALDKGIKPAVITAMAKYNATELARKVINDGMDVMGGAGISLGPKNTLGHLYIATPIGITVEGANIMTRTLIIFGQGGHVVRNMCRAIVLSVTRGYLAPSPVGGSTARYYRKLSWASATFAIMADIAMGSLGGSLKFREKITGRFADILSWMYIGTAVLRRFEAEGRRKEDLPFVHFCMNHALNEIQKSFEGIFANIGVPGLGWFFAGPLRWWSNMNALAGDANDAHTHKIASVILAGGDLRIRHTEGIYIPKTSDEQLGLLEETFTIVKRAEDADRKIRTAIKSKQMPKTKGPAAAKVALEKNVITKQEFDDLVKADELRFKAIQVDDFSQEEYVTHGKSGSGKGSQPGAAAPVSGTQAHGKVV
jgi:acyl-CoA dehydrogenase